MKELPLVRFGERVIITTEDSQKINVVCYATIAVLIAIVVVPVTFLLTK